MSHDKNPIEQAVDQALDAFLYAPIGLVFDGPALFPKLVETGRTQVKVARMMGQMAVRMGQTEAEKRMAKTQGPLRDALVAMGVVTPPEPAPTPPTPPTPPTVDETTVTDPPAAPAPAPKRTAPSPAKAAAKKSGTGGPAPSPTVAPSALAIPDYDSLSASQVVKRLRGMARADLDDVRAYETATRARKTILNRITQLQKD